MPKYYKTSKGYCYKKTQKGGASRISTDAYEKAMVKQKGGVNTPQSTTLNEIGNLDLNQLKNFISIFEGKDGNTPHIENI